MEADKLPVYKTLTSAIFLVKDKYFDLLRLSLPYILISIASIFYSSFIAEPIDSNALSIKNILFTLAATVTLLLATVGAHRVFLMSEEDIKQTSIFRWTSKETRFLGWWIVISLFIGIIAVLGHMFLGVVISSDFILDNSNIYRLLITLVYIPASYVWTIKPDGHYMENILHIIQILPLSDKMKCWLF